MGKPTTITGTVYVDDSNPYTPMVRIRSDETGEEHLFADILRHHWAVPGCSGTPKRIEIQIRITDE